jgi:hypothetical protein
MSQTANAMPPRAPRLSWGVKLSVYVVSAGVWLTGAVWVLLHFAFETQNEFGPSPHPLEFWSLVAHGAFAFASLWLFGLLWGVHVLAGWHTLRRRWSGGILFALFGWLVLSGYLLYYVGEESVREATAVLHWGLGLAGPLPFALHRFAKERRLARPQSPPIPLERKRTKRLLPPL